MVGTKTLFPLAAVISVCFKKRVHKKASMSAFTQYCNAQTEQKAVYS